MGFFKMTKIRSSLRGYASSILIASATLSGVIGILFFIEGWLGILGDNNSDRNLDNYISSSAAWWTFSGLLFLYAAFKAQKESIEIQRSDFQLSVKEMRAANKAFEQQSEELRHQTLHSYKQNVDSVFFKMIELHNEYRKDSNGRDESGRALISQTWQAVRNVYSDVNFVSYESEYDFLMHQPQLRSNPSLSTFKYPYIANAVAIVDFIAQQPEGVVDQEFYYRYYLNTLDQNELLLLRTISIYNQYSKLIWAIERFSIAPTIIRERLPFILEVGKIPPPLDISD